MTKIATLTDRIAKTATKIEKKEATLAKKVAQLEKVYAKLTKLGVASPEAFEMATYTAHENKDQIWEEKCNAEALEETVKRATNEINDIKATLEKYQTQLNKEIGTASVNETVNEVTDVFTKLKNDLVKTWNAWDIEARNKMKVAFKELGYKGALEAGFTKSDYNKKDRTDEQINEANVTAAEVLVQDLHKRIKNIVGEVTDFAGIKATQGTDGITVLNGFVHGTEGSAQVESVVAGGYNVQRLHVRVLVKAF